jgi:PAS domain S-box-containing protein
VSAAAANALRVLLVDDDTDQFALTQAMLDDDPVCRFTIDWASTLEDGLSRLTAGEYDAALIDYRLGAGTGLDLLRSEAFRRSRVPAVMLTAESDHAIDTDAMQAGAVDYLVKHEITPPVLKRAVRYAAERQRVAALLAQREASLAESEARHRSTFDEAPIGMAQTGLDGRWLRVNRRLATMLGFSTAEMLATDFAAVTHPDDLDDNHTGGASLLAGDLAEYHCEKRYRRKDGTFVWVNLSVSLQRDASGAPLHFITVIEDISQRKQAQFELDQIFNLSPDMIATADASGRFTRLNPAWQVTLGHDDATLMAVPFLTFVHPDDHAATVEAMKALANSNRVFGFTNRYRAADGSYRWLEWHAKADVTNGVTYAVARDQTARRVLERQFHQAQKMEAVGRLAGGVAHDFNNLLTAIIGFSEFALDELPDNASLRNDIAQILHAGQSAALLTKQLLAFSRKQILQPQVLDVAELIEAMRSLLRRVIGEDLALEVAVAADGAHLISADRGQIEQVIMNLAVNARDAMPGGGTLRIEIDTVDLDATFVAAHPGSRRGPHVRVTVSDTGIGMDADVIAHLFEPFFTTKDPGKGTGLGLATVYGIVKQSDGYLSVESAPGQGTSFRLHFRPTPVGSTPVTEHVPDRGVIAGTETILVVEDQKEVRDAIRKTLERSGYSVIEAVDGASALARLRAAGRPVHLLLTDVVMPELSGALLAERAVEIAPRLPVLFMSGYTDDAIVHHGVLNPGIDFVPKPFTPTQLLLRVRAALDRSSSRAS